LARLLGFDYGRARIGVAMTDPRQIIVSPAFVMPVEKKLIQAVKNIKIKTDPSGPFEALVVGLPLLLNGKEGEMALEAKAFAKLLETEFNLPVFLWDERLTSAQADRLMKEDDRSRKQRAQGMDTLAATLILQNYLDAKSFHKKQL
jgi:putative Holliday junction resolvase